MINIEHIPSFESIDLRRMRKLTGFSLRKVEEMTGLSNAYLSQLETGKINMPSYETVRTLLIFYTENRMKDIRDEIITGSFIIGEDGRKEPIDWKEYALKLEHYIKKMEKEEAHTDVM